MNRLVIAVVALGLVANSGLANDKIKLPSAEERAKATRLIRDLFKEDYARTGPASQGALAAKLIQQAGETLDDPASQYSLYRETAELAAAINVDLALEACDAVVRRFEGPPEDVLEPMLEVVVAKVAKPEAYGQVAVFAMRRADALLADDEIEAARRLHKIAEESAEKAKSLKIVKQVQSQAGEIEAYRQTQDAVARARQTLKSKPDDVDAVLVLGKHFCFLKGDWAKGLPLLAKSADTKLKQLATKDLETNEDDGPGCIAIADAWYDALASIQSHPKRQVQLRVHGLYSKALPGAAGLTRVKLEKRLDELEKALPPGRIDHSALWPVLRSAVASKSYQKVDARGGAFADKEYSDVLPEGGILIGFNYSLGKFVGLDYLVGLQCIYLTSSGEKLGTAFGDLSSSKMKTVKAKPNYAVGKLAMYTGGNWEGMKVVFMRIDGAGLKADDSYESAEIGHTEKKPQYMGEGLPIVGIHGRRYGGGDNAGVCQIGFYTVSGKREGKR